MNITLHTVHHSFVTQLLEDGTHISLQRVVFRPAGSPDFEGVRDWECTGQARHRPLAMGLPAMQSSLPKHASKLSEHHSHGL